FCRTRADRRARCGTLPDQRTAAAWVLWRRRGLHARTRPACRPACPTPRSRARGHRTPAACLCGRDRSLGTAFVGEFLAWLGFGAEGADRRPGAPSSWMAVEAKGADRRPEAPLARGCGGALFLARARVEGLEHLLVLLHDHAPLDLQRRR